MWDERRLGTSCRRRGVSLMKASTGDSRAVTGKWRGSALFEMQHRRFLWLPQSEFTAFCSRRPPRQSPWVSSAPSVVPAQGLRSPWASCTGGEKEDKDLLAHSPRLPPANPSMCLRCWKGKTKKTESKMDLILERGWDSNEYYIVLFGLFLSKTRIWTKTIEDDVYKYIWCI